MRSCRSDVAVFLCCGETAIGQPRNWEELEKKEVSFEDAEKTRLLYVASTRARETAIVSVRRGSKGQEWRGPWADLGPFLERALPPPIPYRIPDRRVLAAATLESEREVARHARLARRVASGKPSYGTTTVTALAHEIENAAARPFASATGKGMSWGSALHRILEAVMRDPSVDLRVFAANVLAEEDRPPEDLEEALSAVEGVRGSPLWKRALASRRCLVEVPFSLSVPSAELGRVDGPPETLLAGAIDLVFEEDDGWVLVDYKSDTVRDNLDALVRFYEPQLAHYRRVWEETTGRPTRAGLYFLDGGREVWL